MLRQNTNALGIIFPNSYDNTVPELVTERAMASIPFAGRYRMVDFVLSSMANCGISNVSIVSRSAKTRLPFFRLLFRRIHWTSFHLTKR